MFRSLLFWTVFFTTLMLGFVGITFAAFSSTNVGGLTLQTVSPVAKLAATTPQSARVSPSATPTVVKGLGSLYVAEKIFTLKDASGKTVAAGPGPKMVWGLPMGSYTLVKPGASRNTFVTTTIVVGSVVSPTTAVIVSGNSPLSLMPAAPKSPPALLPSPTPTQTPTPMRTATPVPTPTVSAGLKITVKGEEKSRYRINVASIKNFLDGEGMKYPAIQFNWVTPDEMASLTRPRASAIPAGLTDFSASKKGVAQVLLDKSPFSQNGVAGEIARALCQLLLYHRDRDPMAGMSDGKDGNCGNQAVKDGYKFVGSGQSQSRNVSITGSGPYLVNLAEVSRFLTDQKMPASPTVSLIWVTPYELQQALLGDKNPSLFGGLFIAADLGIADALNINGLSEKGVLNIFIATSLPPTYDLHQTFAHEVTRAYFRYVKGDTQNGGDGTFGNDSAVNNYEKGLMQKYSGDKAFIVPK